jgi:hypothetical protein
MPLNLRVLILFALPVNYTFVEEFVETRAFLTAGDFASTACAARAFHINFTAQPKLRRK